MNIWKILKLETTDNRFKNPPAQFNKFEITKILSNSQRWLKTGQPTQMHLQKLALQSIRNKKILRIMLIWIECQWIVVKIIMNYQAQLWIGNKLEDHCTAIHINHSQIFMGVVMIWIQYLLNLRKLTPITIIKQPHTICKILIFIRIWLKDKKYNMGHSYLMSSLSIIQHHQLLLLSI